MSVSDSSTFVIPTTLVYAVLAAIVGMTGTGGWYMGQQAMKAETIAAQFEQFKSDVAKRFSDDERDARAGVDVVSKNDSRLTRMEAQLGFLVTAASPGSRR